MCDITTLKVKIAYDFFRPTDEELRVQNVDAAHIQVNQVKTIKTNQYITYDYQTNIDI